MFLNLILGLLAFVIAGIFLYPMLSDIKKNPKRLVIDLFKALAIMLGINWLIFMLCVVPSGSMKPTIMPGDVVLILRSYGARTPQTPLHLPYTDEKIPYINIPSYLNWIQLPTYCLPGLSQPKRGDCVVLRQNKTSAKANIPTDVQIRFLKRVLAVPGDRVAIVNGQVYVNGQPQKPFASYQYKYLVKTNQRLPASFFKKHDITDYEYLVSGEVVVYTTEEKAKSLKKMAFIQNVIRVIEKKEARYKIKGYNFADLAGRNKDHIPTFTLPKKGFVITVNRENLALYGGMIREVCRDAKVDRINGRLLIKGKRVNSFTFQDGFYWVQGDNRDNSRDSRRFGPVSIRNIEGKAVMVLLNGKDAKAPTWWNILRLNINWGRVGKFVK